MQSGILKRMLTYNEQFVDDDQAGYFRRGGKPSEKLAIVGCMDTRLITLLTAALGLTSGEACIIKVAGAEVTEPYGAVMRSLLIAIYELDVEEIMIVAHTQCGAQHMSGPEMKELMEKAGITAEDIESVSQEIDLDAWLAGFEDTEASVRRSVEMVRSHPLVNNQVRVTGFIIDTQTGKLTQVL